MRSCSSVYENTRPDPNLAYSGIDNPVNDVFSGEVTGTPSVYDNERGGYIPSGELPKPGGGSLLFQHVFDTTTGNTTSAEYDRWFWFSNPALDWQSWVYPAIDESPTYDKDGNLTSDGRFYYVYDLENRLVQVGNVADRVSFKHDYLGRRVEAKFEENVSSVWTERWTKRYVYDGWHLIAEVDASGYSVGNTFFWGYDISHSIGGAGTIGGLLMQDDGSSQYIPGYDGRGNAVLYISESTGAMVAEFEYDPYGVLLRKDGDYDKFPFRYQTKWDMDFGGEDDLYYSWGLNDYGLRWYQAANGRFINRDPIGEAGGMNLYEAFGGDPINTWDYLGLDYTISDQTLSHVSIFTETTPSTYTEGNGWQPGTTTVGFFAFFSRLPDTPSPSPSPSPPSPQPANSSPGQEGSASTAGEADWVAPEIHNFLGLSTRGALLNGNRARAYKELIFDSKIEGGSIAGPVPHPSLAQGDQLIPDDALTFQVGDRYRTIRGGDPVSFGGSLGDTFADIGTDFLWSAMDLTYRAANLGEWFVFQSYASYNAAISDPAMFVSDIIARNQLTESTGQINMLASELQGTPYAPVILYSGFLDLSANYFLHLGSAAQSAQQTFSSYAEDSLESVVEGLPPKP